jgi:DNA-binding transcriptional regulator YdaS (Cro superfamily)
MESHTFVKVQAALGYDNARMAAEIGLSERMVVAMRSGERLISIKTASEVKIAIKRQIECLKVLHKCVKVGTIK